jgi:CHASE3 domain sensor protein
VSVAGTTREEHPPDAPFRPVRSLRLWLIAAAVLALLAVGNGAAATFVTRGQVHDSTTVLNEHLRPAQTAAQRLLTAYVDEETGQRGFVLTGKESFLEPYRVGVRRAAALEAELSDLLGGRAGALTLLADVKSAAVDWRTHVEAEIATVRARGPEAVRNEARQRQDKAVFDALRQRLDALQVEMEKLVGDEVARLGAAQRNVELAMMVAVVLALLAVASTVTLVHFALTRPLGRLVGQLEAVSSGEYDRRIDASGPEEVRLMAEAAETMRMSVVDRSAELVAAQHELSVHTERQRVAADLHDTTIQRLFGLGLKLSALASQRTELAGTLNSLIDEADAIIRELRQMIFEMNEDAIRAKAAARDAGGDQPGRASPEPAAPTAAPSHSEA